MAVEKKKKTKKTLSDKQSDPDRVLMNPEEWEDKAGRKVISEYHKDRVPQGPAVETSEVVTTKEERASEAPEKPALEHHTMKTSQVFDVSTIEMLAYAVSRSLFRSGVQIPLKVKDVMDMDIAVKDTNVILNTNDVSFSLPPLKIWHIIFSYKGRPVFEYGRGENDTLKIHYGRAFHFLLAMWLGGRGRRKARQNATEKACMEVAQTSKEKDGQQAS
ncbi:MAG TPA: hypothetical protein VMT57_02020 [Candidatus Thermoplasmatota archaeon]|nr:hypothetical protein [Candidatus Thermoplasmatota archaeon]